ncbi:MAG: WbqC family protein [Methanocella sp.]
MNRVLLRQYTQPLEYDGLQTNEARGKKAELYLDGALILSGHQPTLLPYPGFFYRMYHSNIMDICPYDPLSKHTDRYQHRVKIGTDSNWRWLTIPIESSNGCSIINTKIKHEFMSERWMELKHVYQTYPNWDQYKDELKEIFFGYNYLWELNFRFILWIRDILGIKTYLSISYSGQGSDTTERVASQFSSYGSVVYLAGKGSMEYLDLKKYERLTHSTIAIVTYTPPVPFSTVSTLTPLLMYPPQKVLDVLNIRREPIRVIVNGAEYSVDYLNS